MKELHLSKEVIEEIKKFYEQNKDFVDYLAENGKNGLMRAMAMLVRELAES